MTRLLRHLRGSVSLVALCCVAVIGIGLAGYLAVCTQAMKLSGRSYQRGLSEQIAEMGLEEALRAFNKNDWSDWSSGTSPNQLSADWTLNGTTASCNITFPAQRYGQDVSVALKIRVDNYNAASLSTPSWSSSTNYRFNDLVSYSNVWYRCIQSCTGQTPGNLSYWVPAPIPWMWSGDSDYALYDIVNYSGVWYRCIKATSGATIVPVPALPQNWVSSASYNVGDLVLYSDGRLYSCILANSAATVQPTNATYWTTTIYWLPVVTTKPWISGTSYIKYDVVAYNNAQYLCTTANSGASWDASNWSVNLTAVSLAWAANSPYARGAVIFNSNDGNWYYCKAAHLSGSTFSPDAANWVSMVPTISTTATWDTSNSTNYVPGDFVCYSGTWYRCTRANNNATPSGTSQYWLTSDNSRYPYFAWAYRNSADYYFNDVVYYYSAAAGGSTAWYRCKVPYSNGVLPNSSAYWQLALTGDTAVGSTHAWLSGASYYPRDTVYYNGAWFRCVLAHTAGSSSRPSTSAPFTYWSPSPLLALDWDPGKTYNQYDTVRYGGQWYLCLAASTAATNPATNPDTWALAPAALTTWNATASYNLNDTVAYNNTWYRCTTPNTNQQPDSSSSWISTTGANYLWNAATSYSANNYVCYGGVWYRSLVSSSGQSPNNSTYWTALGAPVVYAQGTVTLADGSATRTQLRATLAPAALFPNAIAAASVLNMSSGSTSGVVDSYDGTVIGLTPQGTPTTYTYQQSGGPFGSSPNWNVGYSAVLAGASSSNTTVTVAGGTIQGYVAAAYSTGNTLFAYGSSTVLKGPNSPTSAKIDATRVSRSPSIPQFDIQPNASAPNNWPGLTLPASSTWIAPSSSYDGGISIGTPGATVPSVYTYSGNLDLNNPNEILTIDGPVVLYVSGYFRVRSSGKMIVNASGSATIYFSDSLRITTPGLIDNRTHDPKKLLLVGDVGNAANNHSISTASDFYGIIYLPNTTDALTISSSLQFYGAISAGRISFTAYPQFHYDTSLRYATFTGVDQPYAIAEWRELTDAVDQATMP